MDPLRAVVASLASTALGAAAALQDSFRVLIAWTVGIVSQQAELLTILSQSLTLFLLGVLIAHLRKTRTRTQPCRVPDSKSS
jgi:glucose-6-phosphate-specific signal transduction histidine kinase